MVTSDAGRVLGTPEYMSPEQAMGEPLDVRSDVFSFGIVLYEMLSRARPFTGTSTGALLVAIARDPVPPLRERAPEVDEVTADLVMRCLAKSPAARFAHGGEILSALGGSGSPKAASFSRGDVAPVARTPGERPNARPLAAISLVAIACLSVAGWWAYRRSAPVPVPASASSASAAASSGRIVRLIDLPPPASGNPEALAALAEGMQAQYDGLNSSYRPFIRARELDPMLAVASLRLAEMFVAAGQLGEARRDYRVLLGCIDHLSPRDRSFANALEPIAMSDPPDWDLGTNRLRALHLANPQDVDIQVSLARVLLQASRGERAVLSEARALAESAIELDPRFALAWDTLSRALSSARPEEARRAAEECLRQAPRATNCISTLASDAARSGDCKEMGRYGRRWIAISPDDRVGYSLVASSLAAGGAADSLDEALAQAVAHTVPSDRDARRQQWAAARAALAGDFVTADAAAIALGSTTAGIFDPRSESAVLRVEIARERGDAAAAAAIASGFVKRRGAFEPPPLEGDVLPFMLAAERAGGLLSPEDLAAQMDAWRRDLRAQLGRNLPPEAWLVGDARIVTGRADAEAALASRPPVDELVLMRAPGRTGHVLFLANHLDDAVPLLAEAARSCEVLEDPLVQLRYTHELGLAREGLGDRTGACDAYARVLARWGHAKPRSVTADEARAHAAKLGCP
jgi:serine/threonine-protein kinase